MLNGDPWWLLDFLRTIFSALDSFGYSLLSGMYNIFFTVANAELFSGDIIDTFYSRIQLILGVFMTFKLSLSILQIIINPDAYKDNNKGAAKLITHIALALVMLTLVIPVNIPDDGSNPLTTQINENGILFGFLYQFQNSVVEDNILGKLILGSNAEIEDTDQINGMEIDNMADIGGTMAATVARAFITPRLKSDADANVTMEEYENNIACEEVVNQTNYFNPNMSYNSLIYYINETCDDGGEVYAFDYTLLGGLICSIIMLIIVAGFTIDVAVRAIKLAILRLISPIPIISYVTPGADKDGAFGNWIKTLTSTYLDLFIRLTIIYFGAYIIVTLSEGNFSIWQESTSKTTSLLATVFVIIGILVFMKQAPKFFKDMLGLKGDGHLFSGIGAALGGGALIGGLAGSAIGSYKTGYSEGKELGYGTGKSILRGLGAGAGGILGGAFVGGKALMTNDKKVPSSVFSAMQKRNALRSSGSTFVGRTRSGASAMFMGSSLGGKASKMAELYDNLTKAAQSHKSMVEDEALKDTAVTGSVVVGQDDQGRNITLEGNYRDIQNLVSNARARGDNMIRMRNGRYINLDRINENVMEKLKESQATNYLASEAGRSNAKVQGTAKDLQFAANRVDMKIDAYQFGGAPDDEVKGVKGVIGASINAARDVKSDPRAQYNIADDKAINNTNK